MDRERGVLFDVDKVHALDHAGKHYRVAGPLNLARSPQGRPVLVQAGSSNVGPGFAARTADAVFVALQHLADARAFYADIKESAQAAGREPGHVLVLPGISPYVGDTEAEARELFEELNELTVVDYGLRPAEPDDLRRPVRRRGPRREGARSSGSPTRVR